jgi:hypothetical protein
MCYHYSLERRAKAIRKGIKNEIRFSKRKIRQAAFQKKCRSFGSYSRLN